MTLKVKITDGQREVEIEAPDCDGRLQKMEDMAIRMFKEVPPTTTRSPGFGAGGWSSTAQVERDPEL